MTDPARSLHILVLVAGDRPSPLVERALAHARQQHRVPDEIHVVASPGALARLRRELLREVRGASVFAARCARLGIPRDEVLFNGRTLHAVEVAAGALLADQSERLFQVFRALGAGHARDLSVLVAHDAGALGVLAHAALQLVATPTDRLFVETAPRRRRRGAGNVDWAEIPLLLRRADAPAAQYMDVVSARRTERQRLESPDPLRVDLRRRTLRVGATIIRLPAMQFFWMYYLASAPGERFPLAEITHALSSGRSGVLVTQKLSRGNTHAFPADLQRAFVRLFPHAADKFETMFVRACGPHPGLPSTISKINAALRRALGGGAAPYLIQGGRGAGGYRIALDPACIHFVEEADARRA